MRSYLLVVFVWSFSFGIGLMSADQSAKIDSKPTFHIAKGLNDDGSLLKYYKRGLDYAVNYFGNYGPYHIYLFGPEHEKSVRAMFKERAISRIDPNSKETVDKAMNAYEIDSAMRNELLDLYKILSPFKEVPEVLRSLKEKNLKLAILSNGTPALLNQLVKSNNLDNLFDDLFSIEEVGIYKPDSKVYDIPIKKYNIQKNEVAFLSANTWDVSGGGNYGYNSIWVNRNNNIFDNLDYEPQNEIKNLKRLIDLI